MTKAKPKKKGPPSLYTEVLVAQICWRLAEGETLRSICRDPAMPHKATILRWLADKKKADFRDHYAHAREMQADALFDEALGIPDVILDDGLFTREAMLVAKTLEYPLRRVALLAVNRSVLFQNTVNDSREGVQLRALRYPTETSRLP